MSASTRVPSRIRPRPIVLSGFMATGKSTVGRILANELGLPFVDTDEVLAREACRSVPELFVSEGEARFRDREAALVLPLLDDDAPRVLSFGGGTMTIERVRKTALERALVVTLEASPETIVRRLSSLADRPNLAAASPLDRTRDLLALRRDAYAECHARIAVDDLSPEAIAGRIAELATHDRLAMPLGTRSYAIELADGEPLRLRQAIDELAPSSIVVVTDTNVRRARGPWLDAALRGLSTPVHVIELNPGEPEKTLASVARIWDEALAAGADRDALVLAFGGGVVGDLAGFAASTLLRGVRCVQIATTLLAMVDSSAGGKTGFDLPRGKNLVGSFFQPSRVVLDLEHLTTLPERERIAGTAEIAKIALVENADLFARLEATAADVARGDRDALRPIVRSAVATKIRVVRDDEREQGRRALLNLGHTVGHALETAGGYARWLHGEAVAIGTAIELRAAAHLGRTPRALAERTEALLTALGLPVTVARNELVAAWPHVFSDKKRAGSTVRFPIVTAPGVAHVERIPLEDLRAAVLAAVP